MKTILDLNDEADFELIKVNLMDDGDWEYDRMGLGEVNGRVFLIDLNDSGEDKREIHYVKEGLSINDVLRIGIETRVMVNIDWGYSDNDKIRINWELDGDKEAWDSFDSQVLA